MMPRKPERLPEFQSLLGKLARVPKPQLDREVEKWKHKKQYVITLINALHRIARLEDKVTALLEATAISQRAR